VSVFAVEDDAAQVCWFGLPEGSVIEAGDARASRCWRHETRENPHRGAFAGAVWSEKPHDLAFPDLVSPR